MKSKKAATLPIETIIILILAIIALVVLLIIFSTGIREIASGIFDKIKEALGLWKSAGVE